jgi:hypothetical protein
MKILKELGKKAVFAIIICLIAFGILLLQCFVFSKDKYDPRTDENTNYLKSSSSSQYNSSSGSGSGSNSNSSSSSNLSQSVNGVVNSVTGFAEEAYDSYQNTDVSGQDYNAYNFDDSILMYEGDQNINGVNAVLERLIIDADDSFYSKPSVTLENFGNNNSIVYTDSEEYKSALNDIKNNLEDGASYNISFGYTALHAIVNEIIITKK